MIAKVYFKLDTDVENIDDAADKNPEEQVKNIDKRRTTKREHQEMEMMRDRQKVEEAMQQNELQQKQMTQLEEITEALKM